MIITTLMYVRELSCDNHNSYVNQDLTAYSPLTP